jgi:hypothetical protein
MYSSTELKSVSGITISVPGFGFSALSELNGLQRTGRYLVGDFVQIVIREVAPNPKTRLGNSRLLVDVLMHASGGFALDMSPSALDSIHVARDPEEIRRRMPLRVFRSRNFCEPKIDAYAYNMCDGLIHASAPMHLCQPATRITGTYLAVR